MIPAPPVEILHESVSTGPAQVRPGLSPVRPAREKRDRTVPRPAAQGARPEPGLLVNPRLADLEEALDQAASLANGRCYVRTVNALPAEPVLEHPHGLLLANGHPRRYTHTHMWPTSAVGVAWFTVLGRKFVRVWGSRGDVSGPRHALRLLPGTPGDPEGLHRCWAATFPQRSSELRQRRAERLRRTLERFGPAGEDDRTNLALWWVRVRAYAPGVGLILSDGLSRPQTVEVVVRDPSTGLRHHLSVPPRFGDPGSKTFQSLGSAAARVRAGVAWTFGMKPEEYAPELEA